VLTAELYAIAHDKHLAVIAKAPSTSGAGSSTAAPSRSDAARRDNGGVRRAEILAGNVAYLDIRYFWRLDEARQAVDAAMQLLSRADAMVVDMRNNSGGSPDTVAHLASYLVDGPPTTLFEITPRSGTPATYSSEALSPRLGNLPLYVLTSVRTFSGGEGFAFLLQERGRAEVVGEPTPGAANPGRPYPVNDLFDVVVPNGRLSIAPSGRNWEGTGVAPDIHVPADDALRAAHERALRRLLQAARSDADRKRLDAALLTLGSGHP
jgi:C-terminal processing protease CtpA/Prc